MDNYGRPIRIFYANLLRHGITLRVEEGRLRVGGNTKALSPVYRDEIVKRAQHLVDMLTPAPPEELESYFYRLLAVGELRDAMSLAESLGLALRTTPVNGGWLVEMDPDGSPASGDNRAKVGKSDKTEMERVYLNSMFGRLIGDSTKTPDRMRCR